MFSSTELLPELCDPMTTIWRGPVSVRATKRFNCRVETHLRQINRVVDSDRRKDVLELVHGPDETWRGEARQTRLG